MWKRDALSPLSPMNPSPSPTPSNSEHLEEWNVGPSPKKVSVFNAAIQLEGIIRGEDDIILHGKIKGRVELPGNTVTVGVEGFLEGDIFARTVIVEGAVKGNIRAGEKIILHRTAQLMGNLSCDRVTIEEGARINGSIDMAPLKEVGIDAPLPVAVSEDLDENEALSH